MAADLHQIDCVIFGGGVAGLWLLDEMRRAGYDCVLLESNALGAGQTIWSQGIIHGGLKYTLDGLMNASASAVRDMPTLWRECLEGRREPDLSATRLRAEYCHLWRTDSLSSRLGMIGARVGLRTPSEALDTADRPAALRDCPGTVARVAEPVIDTGSLLNNFAARNRAIIVKYESDRLEVRIRPDERYEVTIADPTSGRTACIVSGAVLLTAGGGNAALAERFGVPDASREMQIRPLQMVLVRGALDVLPELYGHCVDGSRTRVTITSALDREGRRIWQVGGEIAERGAAMTAGELIEVAKKELSEVLPSFRAGDHEFATYQAPRAEMENHGKRPEGVGITFTRGVARAWPTKLVLAPILAERLAASVPIQPSGIATAADVFEDWTRPEVALPPWTTCGGWVKG